jgi:hypothetical protein
MLARCRFRQGQIIGVVGCKPEVNRSDRIDRVFTPVSSKAKAPLKKCVVVQTCVEQAQPGNHIAIDVRNVVRDIPDDRLSGGTTVGSNTSP